MKYLVIFGIVCFVLFLRERRLRREIQRGIAARIAMDDWCNASELLDEWMRTHPNVHPSSDQEGRVFSERYVAAYHAFKATHPTLR